MHTVYCEIDIVFWSRNLDKLAFSVLFTCLKSTYSFYLFSRLGNTKERYHATLKQQEIEMVCLGIG